MYGDGQTLLHGRVEREGRPEVEWVCISSINLALLLLHTSNAADAENMGSTGSLESEAEHPAWGGTGGNSRGGWERRGTPVETHLSVAVVPIQVKVVILLELDTGTSCSALIISTL